MVSEKKVIDEVKKLLTTEFSQANKDKFAVESYPVSLSKYTLKHANGVIMVKELGMSVNLTQSEAGHYYYNKFAWNMLSVGLAVLFRRTYIRQDRVTEICEVCDRIRACLQDHAIFNMNLYVTDMSESIYDSNKDWYYRTIDLTFPYIVEVR